ncbi:MAG TPA: sensor histidine kinase, partial [Pseudogracilibacillus sp.]|nr:sensor histidine kinase [Pseudogracilibacillus sp.]
AIQHKIDAEFIVVGDKNEVRLAHPLKDRIGRKMVGDDNERALQDGKSYISKKEGSIGLSIRGKSPIIKDGDIVGVVSVGYLLEDIHKLVWKQNTPILFLLIVFLGIGMAGAFLIAQHLKKLLHKMEPEEIASLLLQKEAILQSVKEGIIAVDIHNRITLINEATKEILQIETDVIGKRLDVILSFPLLLLL